MKEEYIKKIISGLEHDKKLALAIMQKTKQIISSKQGIITKQQKLAVLKKFSDKKRKIKQPYAAIIKKIQTYNTKPALAKRIIQLKTFYQ